MQEIKKNIKNSNNSYNSEFKEIAKNINLYENLLKNVLAEIIYVEDHEPIKLFRHTHQKWKHSKNNLINLHDKIINEIGRENKSLEEIMKLVSRQI